MNSTPSSTKQEYLKQTHLSEEELAFIYEHNLFKLFVPKALGGLECSLPDALEMIFDAGQRDGSLGWCVNLGAGAGYFSGFFEFEASKTIFGPPKSVIAGSGMNTGTAVLQNNEYTINGEWSKCTGSAHATFFTVNATDEHNRTLSFAVPKDGVEIIPSWELFALKKTSSDAIRIENAIIPEAFAFDMGMIKNSSAYSIHRLNFMPFARYCMAAAYYGIADCFTREVEAFSGHTDPLRSVVSSGWHNLMASAHRTWHSLEEGDVIDDVTGLHESIGNHTKQIFNNTNQIFYQHGMRLSDENSRAHYAYRDVLLGSQHFLLKHL